MRCLYTPSVDIHDQCTAAQTHLRIRVVIRALSIPSSYEIRGYPSGQNELRQSKPHIESATEGSKNMPPSKDSGFPKREGEDPEAQYERKGARSLYNGVVGAAHMPRKRSLVGPSHSYSQGKGGCPRDLSGDQRREVKSK